ncbi:GCN5-related N-acetyltransferase [Methanohalobium evestigatum Z-7303]|uniref:GCN5-related N-acetyltransferase n=1 Tax=Methanohalobium evestigatum (strain ATCC BAA-1072 / DSM 3721 / NBRC 107634 / OCM 161 / Z-7303) TaxID=644295 RepID=D7E9S7_METEZ|nr:GNAT family N-acetyltransferase [Methanohalobium evestigatum]ADI74349.1 GCN5-related N-acetyltransferase [Methanohalobium evestigatum Z-7303]
MICALNIREAYQDDFHRIHRFMELVNDEFFPPLDKREKSIDKRIQQTILNTNSAYLIAESETENNFCFIAGLIGFEKYWKSEDDAYINFLAVHPEYRGMGLSSKLEKQLELKLKQDGILYINVCTWSTNKPVLNFYEKMNYRINSVLKNDRGNGIDTIYYYKCL